MLSEVNKINTLYCLMILQIDNNNPDIIFIDTTVKS